MPEGVLLDTSFFLRFLNENDPLFSKADNYYKYFLQKEIRLFISTISIAEYCVGGTLDQLPLKNLVILPFNIEHAKKTGEFARILYTVRKENKLIVGERFIIINDAKLFAQAHTDTRINYYVTSDTRSSKLYDAIKDKTNINFALIDIRADHSETFGILNLK